MDYLTNPSQPQTEIEQQMKEKNIESSMTQHIIYQIEPNHYK